MGPIDPIEGSKELHGVQTCRRPRGSAVLWLRHLRFHFQNTGAQGSLWSPFGPFCCHFGEPAVTFGTISSVIIDNIELLLLQLINATLYSLSNFNLNTSNILENINDDYLHIERACTIKYQYVWNTHFEYTVVEMQNNFV